MKMLILTVLEGWANICTDAIRNNVNVDLLQLVRDEAATGQVAPARRPAFGAFGDNGAD